MISEKSCILERNGSQSGVWGLSTNLVSQKRLNLDGYLYIFVIVYFIESVFCNLGDSKQNKKATLMYSHSLILFYQCIKRDIRRFTPFFYPHLPPLTSDSMVCYKKHILYKVIGR